MAALNDSVGLLFRIKADSSDAIRDMNRVQSELKTTGNTAQTAGGGFTSMAANVNVAAVAITAITTVMTLQVAAAIKVVSGLYNLAVSASEAGSEIKDMQDKTGLAAVTLSTLKLAADNAGSSFEQVGGGIEKFAKLLGQAKEGNEKAIAAMAALGVGTTDLDEALKQVIKSIADAKDGTDQITLAQKAFGKSGADLIPVIKQINGDLEAAEREAKKLGTTLTESDIKAADEFGDTLGVLSTQVSTLANRFALQFAPEITKALNEIITFLARNQDVAVEWGRVIADVCRGVVGVFSYAKNLVGGFLAAIGISFTNSASQARGWAMAILAAINPVLLIMAQIGRIVGANTPKEAQEGGGFVASASGIPSGSPGGGGGKGGGGGGGKSDAEAKAREELQAQIEGQQFVLSQLEKNYKDTMKRIREEFKRSGDSDAFTLAANKANEELSNGANAVLAVLDALERKALKDPTATKSKNLSNKQQKRADDLNILKSEDFEENAQLIADAVQKIFDDLKKIATDNAKDTHDILVRNAYDELAAVKDANLKILESEWSTKKQRIAASDAIFAAIKKNAGALIYENKAVHENSIMDLNDWRDAQTAEINKTIQDEELRKGALETVNTEYQRRLDLINEIFDKEKAKIDEATAVPVVATPDYNFGIADSWDQFVASIMQDGPTVGQTLETLGQIGMNAFKGMAEGIGSMISAWVLYGSAGPNAMKKMVASVLAGVAAQSAVLAIFELAKGFAALFFNPAEAAAHFHAAALFGSIAVATGLAGRAVAGDAFNQQAGGTGSSGGSGGDAAGQPERLNFTERFEGFLQRSNDQVANMLQRTNEVLGGVAESVDTFNQKFGVTTPGAVVMAGAGDAGEAIFGAVTGHLDSDLRASSDFLRSQGKMQ